VTSTAPATSPAKQGTEKLWHRACDGIGGDGKRRRAAGEQQQGGDIENDRSCFFVHLFVYQVLKTMAMIMLCRLMPKGL